MKKIISILLIIILISSLLLVSASAKNSDEALKNQADILFDSSTLGWKNYEKFYLSIKKSDKELLYELYSEESLCTDKNNDGIYEYSFHQISDIADEDYPLTLRFHNENGNTTSSLTMEKSDIGDTVLSLSKSTSGIPIIVWSKDMTLNNAVKVYENKNDTKVETNRFYFLMPDGQNGSKGDNSDLSTYLNFADSWYNDESDCAGIYLWESDEFETQWPGYKMSKDYEKGIYYADVPTFTQTFIINNHVKLSDDPNEPINKNHMQTAKLYNSGYKKGECKLYPDGLENFNNMIYVIDPDPIVLSGPYAPEYIKGGQWYFYYGNGCYGIQKDGNYIDCIRGDHHHDFDPHNSTISVKEAVKQYESDTGEKTNTHRYYFMMPDGKNSNTSSDGEFAPSWYSEHTDTASVFWWEHDFSPKTFPGYTMENGDTENIFYADIPDFVTTLIFNNNVSFSYMEEDLYRKYNMQTVNVPCEYYDAGESDNYPYGTDSFDNMIYVLQKREISTPVIPSDDNHLIGEWYYYYGNGCFGTEKGGNSKDCIHPSHFDKNGKHIVEGYLLGDADDDGILSVMDATYIQMALVGLKSFDDFKSEFIADIDKDKSPSVMDATIIQKSIAKLDT